MLCLKQNKIIMNFILSILSFLLVLNRDILYTSNKYLFKETITLFSSDVLQFIIVGFVVYFVLIFFSVSLPRRLFKKNNHYISLVICIIIYCSITMIFFKPKSNFHFYELSTVILSLLAYFLYQNNIKNKPLLYTSLYLTIGLIASILLTQI